MPDYTQTVEKLRTMRAHFDSLLGTLTHDERATFDETLALLTEQDAELATLRAENARLREARRNAAANALIASQEHQPSSSPREPQKDETLPTRESVRAELVQAVGECCGGADPLCEAECLVVRAIKQRDKLEPREPHAALIAPQPNLSAAVQTLEKALERCAGPLMPRHPHLVYENAIREALALLARQREDTTP